MGNYGQEAKIVHKVHARIGLLGNPSDGYHGRVISLSLKNFSAQVSLTPAEGVEIKPHLVYDSGCYNSLQDLARTVESCGYNGGAWLLKVPEVPSHLPPNSSKAGNSSSASRVVSLLRVNASV